MASTKSNDPSDPVHAQASHSVLNSSNDTTIPIPPNPYFLSSSENPRNILVTQPLLGMKNYQSWSRAMILALTAKKKIGFVNGKITKPNLDSPLYEDWESCNTMVLSWVIKSMHVNVFNSIMYCETAKEMWIKLQNVFAQGNGPKIYNMQREISHITQNQMTVTKYYTKFKRLWDQLLNYEPLPQCSCGAMKLLNASHNKAYDMRFLMGLENFKTLRSQILTYDHFPSMSKVYALVLQEESHKTIGHGGSSASQNDVVAIGADNSSSRSNLCPISKAQCEQLLAYLTTGPGVGDAHHAAIVRASSVASVDCNPSGALEVNISRPQNNLASCSNVMSSITSHIPYTPNLSHSIFSAKIVNKNVLSKSYWVIDTGATNHMVYSISCFFSITATLNTHINLPNGEVALVTHISTVRISNTLLLQNVLCVPSFIFNLISVSQLAKSILCCLIYFGNLCFIQDLAHWSTIGLGKEINGLYLLQKGESTSTSNCLSASILDYANKIVSAFVNKMQPYI
ncbi:uncharacterized protein LOC142625816 [Castanea sativa]|uniref:uncharacterized protein LOC142625816 n=1 Tax=Castanea sativa TaxID=21020 RepID=UPI003F64AFB5